MVLCTEGVCNACDVVPCHEHARCKCCLQEISGVKRLEMFKRLKAVFKELKTGRMGLKRAVWTWSLGASLGITVEKQRKKDASRRADQDEQRQEAPQPWEAAQCWRGR